MPSTKDEPQPTASTETSRRPYHGSCHCGFTKYIVYLTFPPSITATRSLQTDQSPQVRLRKCNCTTCHKLSFFHIRLPSSPNDFLLLSPLSPSTELKDYTCFDAKIHWYFCPKCGVRCFAHRGGEVVREVEVEGEKKKVWTAEPEGWKEGVNGYLSVNAQTLEAGQEGLDLREWHEKGWIAYLDVLSWPGEVREPRMKEPYEGGIY